MAASPRVWLSRALLAPLGLTGAVLAAGLCTDALTRAVEWRSGAASWQGIPAEVAAPALAALVLTGCIGWLLLITAATAVEAVTGRSVGCLRRATPESLRRLVTMALGVAVTGAGVLGPAAATPDPCPAPRDRACIGGVAGLPVPDRAVGVHVDSHVVPARQGARARPAPGSHVVEHGDSLWRIAAGRLPAAATATDVDAAWRHLYRLNRDRIGADPDHLHVGLQLRVPRLQPTAREEDQS